MVEKKVKFKQEFLIPVQVPVLSDRLVLSFYDQAVGSDNLIGSLVLSMKKLI
jgi:hypothetical protein